MADSAISRTSNGRSSHSTRHDRSDHDRMKDGQRRHRSRSRDHGDRKRKTRDDADRERDEPRSKRHTSEARSRSPPRRDRERDTKVTRQRSPPRGPRAPGPRDGGRERDRSRERNRDRNGERASRVNGASAPTNGTRSRKEDAQARSRDVQMANGAVDEDDESAMQRIMGFGAFRSTKNSKVPGNNKNYGVRKEKKTEYRQYMNRQGGFNRPLSPGR